VDLLNGGNPVQAEQEWRTAAQLAPRSASAYRALGALYLSQGRFPEARWALNRLVDLAPREPHALCELAEAEHRRGEPELIRAAAEDGERAARLEPECIRAQTVAGTAWTDLGDTRRGVKYLREAVRLSPADVPLAQQVVRVLLEAQQLDEAARLARSITVRYPGYAQGYALLAACYRLYPPESRQARELPGALRRCLALEPTNGLGQAMAGQYHLRAGDARKAAGHLEAARLLNPRRTDTLFALSRAYKQLGRMDEATQVAAEFRRRSTLENEFAALEKRFVIAPTRAIAIRLARLATALGEPERAQRYTRGRESAAP
jgi:tetratricopeptide (TPR) repeat protein